MYVRTTDPRSTRFERKEDSAPGREASAGLLAAVAALAAVATVVIEGKEASETAEVASEIAAAVVADGALRSKGKSDNGVAEACVTA